MNEDLREDPRGAVSVLVVTERLPGHAARESGREVAERAAARWLDCSVADLPAWDRSCAVCGSQHGKPRLPGTELDLSLTRAAGLVIVAGVRSAQQQVRVGVDAESLSVLDRAGGIRDFLGSVEVVSPQEQLARRRARRKMDENRELLGRWVWKEALLKAMGVGLKVPMSAITIGERAGSPALVDWDEERAAYPRPGSQVALGEVRGEHAPADLRQALSGVVTGVAVVGARRAEVSW